MPGEMISTKLLVMRRLAKHLSDTIRVENGYPLSLEGKIFRGRNQFGDDTTTPFVAILEAPRQIDPNGAGDEKWVLNEAWTLLIQGFATDDPLNPTDPAYILLACVQKALSRLSMTDRQGGNPVYPAEFKLGDLISVLRFQTPIVRPPDNDVSDTAFFYLPVTVDVVTDMSNPFVEED